jgi:hypothetical protein
VGFSAGAGDGVPTLQWLVSLFAPYQIDYSGLCSSAALCRSLDRPVTTADTAAAANLRSTKRNSGHRIATRAPLVAFASRQGRLDPAQPVVRVRELMFDAIEPVEDRLIASG